MSQPEQMPNNLIIIAESLEPHRKRLCESLQSLGFQVLATEDGQQAWDALQKNPHAVAVICTFKMPNIAGLELLTRIRSSNTHSRLPVFMLASVTDKDYIQKTNESDLNGYILKPATPARLKPKLQPLLLDQSLRKNVA